MVKISLEGIREWYKPKRLFLKSAELSRRPVYIALPQRPKPKQKAGA